MKDFFYKNWVLFYVVFFFLLGILIHALLWEPSCNNNQQIINDLNKQLNECQNNVPIIDTTSNKPTVVGCNATVKSGGQGTTTTIHSLGNTGGKVIVVSTPNGYDPIYYEIYDQTLKGFNNFKISSEVIVATKTFFMKYITKQK